MRKYESSKKNIKRCCPRPYTDKNRKVMFPQVQFGTIIIQKMKSKSTFNKEKQECQGKKKENSSATKNENTDF